jgi:hypothetical protein
MKFLWPLSVMIALAVTPVDSFAQESTIASSNPRSKEAQNTTQTPPPPAVTQGTQGGPNATLENTVEAAEPLPRRDFVHWNEYHGPYFTIRAGAGVLVDYAAFAQDDNNKEQFAFSPDGKLRDFRFIMGGKLPSFKRPVTWCAGVMYDAPTHT